MQADYCGLNKIDSSQSHKHVCQWVYVFYEVMTSANAFLLMDFCRSYRKNTLTQIPCSYNRHFKALSREGQASTVWMCVRARERERWRDQGHRAIKVPVIAGQRNAGGSRDGQSNWGEVKFRWLFDSLEVVFGVIAFFALPLWQQFLSWFINNM